MNRHLPRPSAALVVASLSLVVSCSGVAMAATGNLVLGAKNQATKTTTLKTSASLNGATLKLKNTGTGPAASFVTQAGRAPFRVKSATKVTGLNADLLDGLDASAFRRTGDTVDAATLDGLDSTAFRKVGDPVDAGTLDGVDSSAFLRGDTTPLTVSVLRLNPQTTMTAQGTTLSTDFEVYDPSGMHAAGASSDLTAPRTGTYVVSVSVQWDPATVGYRNTGLVGPDGTFATAIGPAASSPAVTMQNVSGITHLAAGQSVHVEVLQGSGGNLNVRIDRFAMTYVGP